MLAQQIEIGDHRHQQIVEIVGHAAGDLADGLHLLRLAQLLLGALALFDLAQHGAMGMLQLGGALATRSSSVSFSRRR